MSPIVRKRARAASALEVKYSGSLARPVKRHGPPFINALDPAAENHQAAAVDKALEKIPELFKAHRVEPGNWQLLALRLAFEHVPGFQIVSAGGRPLEVDAFTKADLRVAVDDLVHSRPELSVTAALAAVVKRDDWKKRLGSKSIDALKKLYYSDEAKRLADYVPRLRSQR